MAATAALRLDEERLRALWVRKGYLSSFERRMVVTYMLQVVDDRILLTKAQMTFIRSVEEVVTQRERVIEQ